MAKQLRCEKLVCAERIGKEDEVLAQSIVRGASYDLALPFRAGPGRRYFRIADILHCLKKRRMPTAMAAGYENNVPPRIHGTKSPLNHLALAHLKINRSYSMAKDEHNKAAEHHENAAKSHRAAAEHHGKSDHAKGKEHSTNAQQHSQNARQHSEQAHSKSQQQK
jgi:hypothetical protein